MRINISKITIAVLLTIVSIQGYAKGSNQDNNNKIDEIIKSLTLEEKVGQLNLVSISGPLTSEHIKMIKEGKIGNILQSNGVERNLKIQKIAVEESRSGLPILFQEDVIHGYRTITPIPLAEAASWDLEMIKSSATVAAREASSAGIMLTYAPMLDVARDPRWGRILETSGEDPYLGGCVGAARVDGFQNGNKNKEQNILSCAKHFVTYGASLAGRDYNIQDVSQRELREVHLPPFQAAINAGVSSIMCAYTMYDGKPLTINEFLLKDVLRDEMNFKGLVMTDWSTINNLVRIGVCEDYEMGAEMAIKSGIDMDMTSDKFVENLVKLVKDGRVDEKLIDNAVRNVLILKDKAGLLDNPYINLDKKREKRELLSEENKAAAKEMALKSMVLLKNNNKILPIEGNKVKKIAVIGPLIDAQRDLLGWWSGKGKPSEVVTIREALKAKFGDNCEVNFAAGCKIDSFKVAGREFISPAVELAKESDIVIMMLGERYWMSGEGGGVASLDLPGAQIELLNRVNETGKPIISVIITGRPYVLTDVAKNSDAILQAWMPGTMGSEAIADILAGDYNPSGKLPVTFPLHQGQIPLFYSYKRTSHSFNEEPAGSRYSTTYRDIESKPLYPFGYGLSYTTYEYGDIKLNKGSLNVDGSITATIEIKNSGDRKGREVVQLYIGDEVCSVVRPIMELKDFKIVELNAGESKNVSFTITSDKLEFIGSDYKKRVEPGKFNLYIGANSNDVQKTSFTLE